MEEGGRDLIGGRSLEPRTKRKVPDPMGKLVKTLRGQRRGVILPQSVSIGPSKASFEKKEKTPQDRRNLGEGGGSSE